MNRVKGLELGGKGGIQVRWVRVRVTWLHGGGFISDESVTEYHGTCHFIYTIVLSCWPTGPDQAKTDLAAHIIIAPSGGMEVLSRIQ